MQHIDFGLSCFHAEALDGWKPGEVLDLSIIYQRLIAKSRLAAYEVTTRFYEVGSHTGLAETDAYLRAHLGQAHR